MANLEAFTAMKAASAGLIRQAQDDSLFCVVILIDPVAGASMLAASHQGSTFYKALRSAIDHFELGEKSGVVRHEDPRAGVN